MFANQLSRALVRFGMIRVATSTEWLQILNSERAIGSDLRNTAVSQTEQSDQLFHSWSTAIAKMGRKNRDDTEKSHSHDVEGDTHAGCDQHDARIYLILSRTNPLYCLINEYSCYHPYHNDWRQSTDHFCKR